MTNRIAIGRSVPGIYQAMSHLQSEVEKAAANAGLEGKLLELVKIRASQINGCAFCLDLHTTDSLGLGESPRRIFVLEAWREVELFSEQERAALALTESMTLIADHKDVPDDVYAEAVRVFTEAQYRVLAWSIVAINAWNRISVASHSPLPERQA
ncbi:carboxymuconolactone decarboxylase family protein [Amycolatopsis sp. PS_44_ISF1]|uniref:carboxymuconolactone decarboxylase family protein n=1 Tax=Amycolatopsis sp. PS_44_ISF1 TaxID=2974917 RepID=UPI0028DD8820|nr:carboxymuconolactone decarboxylase family protein [Amycolatopsis sp. PS_44_ISF1]MDT8916162.1 carboxymuconolactone decarboxylase family protein [Amycolatopsis sp. PS_44_ISF1]